MSQDSPDEPPPWVMGPPENYDPPPIEGLIDPARIAAKGRDLVLAVPAEKGIRPGPKHWITPNTTEGA